MDWIFWLVLAIAALFVVGLIVRNKKNSSGSGSAGGGKASDSKTPKNRY